MVKKQKVEKSKFDALKWLVVLALIVGGVLANSYYAEVSVSIRIIAWIVLIAFALFVASLTAQGKTSLQFMGEARIEMRKVVWPTREETIRTTVIVMALVLVVAVFLWIVDTGLIALIGWLTGQ